MTFGSVPICSAVYNTENFQFVSVSVVELSFHTCCESQCSQSVFMGGNFNLCVQESDVLTSWKFVLDSITFFN